jgi:hypothetical protein
MMGADPIGVLLPSSALLLTYTLWLSAAAWLPWPLGGAWWWAGFLGLGIVRVLVIVPFRIMIFRSGAGQMGIRLPALQSVASLAVVSLLASIAEAGLVGVLLSGAIAPAWWLAARGSWISAALLVSGSVPLIVLVAIVVRMFFGYAAVEAGIGGQTPFVSLARGLTLTQTDVAGVGLIALAGEVAFILGGLLCGLGSLPAAPWVDLALLHRWHHLSAQEPG